ncbi:hypothetical protein C8F01DRAFT_143920 [Mycena amicta]|nr:hypothetical protein C8F01DRAFT_143920 [Mycena amicta]
MLFAKALLFAAVVSPSAFAMPSQPTVDVVVTHAAVIDQSRKVYTNVRSLENTMALISQKHPNATAVVKANGYVSRISRCTLPPSGQISGNLLGLGDLGDLLNGLLGGLLSGTSGVLGNTNTAGGGCSLCSLLANTGALVTNLLDGLGLGGLLGGLGLGGLLGGGSSGVVPAPDADLVKATMQLLDDLLDLGNQSGCGQDYLTTLLNDINALIDSCNGLLLMTNPKTGGCGCGGASDVINGVNAVLKGH